MGKKYQEISDCHDCSRRIIFFFFVSGTLLKGMDSAVAWTYLPETARVGLPYIGWLIKIIPISPEIYNYIRWIGVVLAISGLIGFQTKWTLKLYIPIAFYLWAVPCFYGKLNHNQIMLWIPVIFAFSRCSDVCSVDALIKRFRKRWSAPKNSFVYGLPLTIIWIHLAMIYCFSGFHKLWDTGLYWGLSNNIINQIQLEWVENYDMIVGLRVDRYPTLLKFGAVGIILFEIVYPLFLIKPTTRFINFIGAWSLHLTAGYLMNIDFVDLRRAHFSLINWSRVKSLKVFKKKLITTRAPYNQKYFKTKALVKHPVFYPGLILVIGNFICGFIGINSWPFSAYPAYSGIVEDTVKVIRIEAYDNRNRLIDVKALGKAQVFRWENIRPFETAIADLYQKQDSLAVQLKINEYWELWRSKVSGLEKIKKVKMILQTTPLTPEKRHVILDTQELGAITINN